MKTRFFLLCSLIFGGYLLSAASPALALTENGRSLLDDLRSRVGKSSVTSSLKTEMPEPARPTPPRPSESPTPAPAPLEISPPKDRPLEASTEQPLSTLPDNPQLEESKPREESKSRNALGKSGKKPAKSEDQAMALPAKSSPPPLEQDQSTSELPSQNGRMSSLVQNLRKKLETRDHDHSPGSQIKESGKPRLSKPEPISPQPTPISPPVAVEPSKEEAPLEVANAAPMTKSSGSRSFAELSDEELIQYAEEHVWSAEKSRKHHPPPTPPYRPKKKKEDAKASGKSDAAGKKSPVAPVSKTPVKKNKSSKKVS